MIVLRISILLVGGCILGGTGATIISGGANDEPTGLWNFTYTDLIRRNLLPGYDRLVRPNETNQITPVKFSLTAVHFYIDEARSIASLVGWMKVSWHDGKLRWNATDYGNVDVIRVSSEEIWKPDIELYNLASKPPLYGTRYNMLVYSDGSVLWVPPVKFDVLCKLNLKAWPRDTQTCRFVFGSWTHHTLIVDLGFDNSGFEKINQSWEDGSAGKWKIKDIHTERFVQYYNCCAEPYTSLQYDITVERRASAHAILNEAPVVALIIVMIAAAILEPSSRGLPLFAVAVVSSIYLVALIYQFPNFGSSPPRIAVLHCGLLMLAAVWGVTSAVAQRMSSSELKPLPGALRRFVKKSKLNISVDEDGVAMSPEGDKEAAAPESHDDNWSEVAKLFDRVFLAVGGLGLALLIVLSF